MVYNNNNTHTHTHTHKYYNNLFIHACTTNNDTLQHQTDVAEKLEFTLV